MTPEQQAVVFDAHERVRELEPFSDAELERLRAIPGVTETPVYARVRKGTILRRITVSLISDVAPPDLARMP